MSPEANTLLQQPLRKFVSEVHLLK